MKRARVLLADDHPGMLQSIANLIGNEFDVVATVDEGEAAVTAAALFQPDLAVFDISMPNLTGIEAAERVLAFQGRKAVRIVFLTVHDDPEFIEAAGSVGAVGYVLKRRIATDLLPTLRRAMAPDPAEHP